MLILLVATLAWTQVAGEQEGSAVRVKRQLIRRPFLAGALVGAAVASRPNRYGYAYPSYGYAYPTYVYPSHYYG